MNEDMSLRGCSNHRASVTALLCLALVGASTQLSAQLVGLGLEAIGPLPGGRVSSAYAINNSGQVVGQGDVPGSSDHAFLYSGGTLTDLGTLGGSRSYGRGINDASQVTGVAHTSVTAHAFVYSAGVMTDLLGAAGEGHDINDVGQVTGGAIVNNQLHAFLYSEGTMTDLGTLGGSNSLGFAINSSGQVTGYAEVAVSSARHAFLYSEGSMTDLGTFGGRVSYGNDINDASQVVGLARTAGDAATHAFLYSEGTMTDLGTLGGTNSGAYGINDSGQIVGYANTAGSTTARAFLYSDGVMFDLNTLLEPFLSDGSSAGFTQLNYAEGINDFGQIVGRGQYYTGTQYQSRAFIASVGVNAPSSVDEGTNTLALLGFGLASLLGLRRRCRTEKTGSGFGAWGR